jgi:hypothetical protein
VHEWCCGVEILQTIEPVAEAPSLLCESPRHSKKTGGTEEGTVANSSPVVRELLFTHSLLRGDPEEEDENDCTSEESEIILLKNESVEVLAKALLLAKKREFARAQLLVAHQIEKIRCGAQDALCAKNYIGITLTLKNAYYALAPNYFKKSGGKADVVQALQLLTQAWKYSITGCNSLGQIP